MEDILLEERFNDLLPGLIYETGIDLWILISREPYIKNMLPGTCSNTGSGKRTRPVEASAI